MSNMQTFSRSLASQLFCTLVVVFRAGISAFSFFCKHMAIWNGGERKSVWVGRIFLASAFASLRLLCLCGLSIVFFLFLSKDLTDYVLTKVEMSAAFAIVFIRIQVRFFGPCFGPFPDFRPLVLFPLLKKRQKLLFFSSI